MPPAAAISRAATHLKVLSAGAVKYVVTDVAAQFTRDTGDEIEFSFATIGDVQKRLAHGEIPDLDTAHIIFLLLRRTIAKNGAPKNAVTTPIGSSAGAIIVRPSRSARIKNAAPNATHNGKITR